MPKNFNEERAQALLKFITETACPYGAPNLGAGNLAREKILAIRAGKDNSLDWNKLEAPGKTAWTSEELKGVKAAIANDFLAQTGSQNTVVNGFKDVVVAAKKSITFGIGRCSGLACVGLVYNQELLPKIGVTALHYQKKGVLSHTLLLVGFAPEMPVVKHSEPLYFCDPWLNTVGSIQELDQHLAPLGFEHAKDKQISRNWFSDGSISNVKPVIPDFLANRSETLRQIEEIYAAFVAKNTVIAEAKMTRLFSASQIPLGLKTQYKLPDDSQLSCEKGLRNAAAQGNLEDLTIFIRYIKNINAFDNNPKVTRTALHWAAIKGDQICYDALIAAGAKDDLQDKTGITAKQYSIF